MKTSINISPAEYQSRIDRLAAYLDQKNLSVAVLYDPYYILYFTGFAFTPTERPITFFVTPSGEKGMLVPRLEVEHAKMYGIDHVAHYPEYPSVPHPIQSLADILKELGVDGNFGSDGDGYPPLYGYKGPKLSDLVGAQVTDLHDFIEGMMMIKSPAEQKLIRESCTWGNLAHTLLQRYTRVGVTETDTANQASNEATRALMDSLGPIYRGQHMFFQGAVAMYRGQIGRGSAIPHALANNIMFQRGDVLVSGAGSAIWGYGSELERTMIIEPVSDDQRRFFDHMVALQDIAFETIKPGVPCSDVDKAVRKYYEDNDLMQYWRHHVGHGLGMRIHEAPFLDINDHTQMAPGMVLSVEPGLYVPSAGGFRHSDTVLVTEDGMEILTFYPRDLESLTILS
ncbi:MAG: aminopeptidase P family protein [Deltaproteobacteria bacterium]|nr:aminopeptidase P family protein [Deltaproteobacteria bacterium]